VTTATETFPAIEARPRARGDALRRLLFAFVITLLAGAAFSAAFVLGYAKLHEGRVMPGVTVGGVAVGGLDRASAEAAVREHLPPLGAGSLTVTIGGSSQRISYADLGRDYDLEPILDRAFAVGRTGTLAEQVSDQLASLTHGIAFEPGMRFDQPALDRIVAAAARSVETAPVDATIGRSDSGFATTPSSTGLDVDETDAVRAASRAIASTATTSADTEITLQPTVLLPTLTTETVQAAAATATALSSHDIQMTAKDKSWTITAATIRTWVDFSHPSPSTVDVTLDTSSLPATIEPFAEELSKPGTNATFKFEGAKVVAVPGTDGEALDVTSSVALVESAIRGTPLGAPTPTVNLAVMPVKPDYTTEQAIADAPKMRRVSMWTTMYVPSNHNFYGKNISTPATKISGYLLPAGKLFDFWKVVGEVSKKTGYGQGAAIINGRSQPTAALAGGICSCSTTLFNTALRLGLDMGARRNHFYYITRYPLGLDATVFKGSGSVQNLTFRNDTPYPILIRGVNWYGHVRFEMWSQPTNRTVTITDPIVRSIRVATEETACTPDLPPGSSRRVELPTNGMQVWRTVTVTDASGTILHRVTFHSNYGKVNGLVLFGKTPGFTGPCFERLPT
jgi:vancomycin resistance protein YoaR